jgi:hypothetical protein
MYGTVARTRVKQENREELRKIFEQQAYVEVPGFVTSYMLFEEGGDVAWLFAAFEGRDTYERNAGDPAQHERYLEYRRLLEDEPEWHDGEIETV